MMMMMIIIIIIIIIIIMIIIKIVSPKGMRMGKEESFTIKTFIVCTVQLVE